METNRLPPWLREWWLLITFIVLKLLIHFLTNTNYELHRDSLLYIEQGRHLAWGYQSTPPSIAVFANIAKFLFGDNVFAIRLFPALIGAASILLIGLMVKQLNGKQWALFIACFSFLISPAFLRSNTLFQPVSFNQFYWLLLTYLVFNLIRTNNPRYWIWIGIISGLGLLNKHSIIFYFSGLFLALLVTPQRKWLGTWYPYMAAGVALLISLPHILWQHQRGWPVIRHMKELAETQLIHVRVDLIILEQFLMNLPAVLVWLAGLALLLFLTAGKEYRILGWKFVFVLTILILLRGKPYYTLGLYPPLFAFGGFMIEKYFSGRLNFVRFALIGLMLILSLPLLPMSLPILKPDQYIHFYQKLGMEKMERWEDGQYHDLPQDYADMIGWKELTSIVADTYNKLTPEQQKQCTILAKNYGEAGAINFYGKKYNLPDVVSFSDSYRYWAPDSTKADFMIKIGESDNLHELYYHVEIVGRITTPHARQEGTPVYFCSDQKTDVNKVYQEELSQVREQE